MTFSITSKFSCAIYSFVEFKFFLRLRLDWILQLLLPIILIICKLISYSRFVFLICQIFLYSWPFFWNPNILWNLVFLFFLWLIIQILRNSNFFKHAFNFLLFLLLTHIILQTLALLLYTPNLVRSFLFTLIWLSFLGTFLLLVTIWFDPIYYPFHFIINYKYFTNSVL